VYVKCSVAASSSSSQLLNARSSPSQSRSGSSGQLQATHLSLTAIDANARVSVPAASSLVPGVNDWWEADHISSRYV